MLLIYSNGDIVMGVNLSVYKSEDPDGEITYYMTDKKSFNTNSFRKLDPLAEEICKIHERNWGKLLENWRKVQEKRGDNYTIIDIDFEDLEYVNRLNVHEGSFFSVSWRKSLTDEEKSYLFKKIDELGKKKD